MEIGQTIDKHLNEKNQDDLWSHVRGAKGTLDDIVKMVEYNNIKMARKSYRQLMKNLKLLEKFLK